MNYAPNFATVLNPRLGGTVFSFCNKGGRVWEYIFTLYILPHVFISAA
jgi:hypothetical protein